MVPFLPSPDRPYTVEDIQALGKDRSEKFYHTALHYAQTLWLSQFPAKTLLLINRALSCNLPEVSLRNPWQPYQAVAWILTHRPDDAFIGNPRRHYQHLATRMVEPHKTLRTWRAWACWYLACKILPEAEFPGDEKQIREEGIIEPRRADIEQYLRLLSPNDDTAAWLDALAWIQQPSKLVATNPAPIDFELITPDELPRVALLANRIWPVVYPAIISMEQIRYMLDTMYEPNILRQEMRERGIHYAIIRRDQTDIGYLAWEPNPSNASAFLHKLYLLPEHHGHGVGAHALRWIHQSAAAQQLQTIGLRVNKNNHAAIRAYLREGYQFQSSICSDIGNGFVMDDHLMSREL
ncbi:GNAT family N-acetyltransferase [Phragmitibacter flavus]|uniref:GNAT family N-acetyltransferase n=1 Tax=Phragmitibacter flavus TaxID=2576071 RepID=A0A5R8KFM2_9BACT|nr:GNAT family N-acetyltransferase [Phragmitibacter flavus]TLD70755.1 GNAT family N-acetyltransferase [Phragmitibacter flavus]